MVFFVAIDSVQQQSQDLLRHWRLQVYQQKCSWYTTNKHLWRSHHCSKPWTYVQYKCINWSRFPGLKQTKLEFHSSNSSTTLLFLGKTKPWISFLKYKRPLFLRGIRQKTNRSPKGVSSVISKWHTTRQWHQQTSPSSDRWSLLEGREI